jgi:hypothetical protein
MPTTKKACNTSSHRFKVNPVHDLSDPLVDFMVCMYDGALTLVQSIGHFGQLLKMYWQQPVSGPFPKKSQVFTHGGNLWRPRCDELAAW